MATIVIPRKRLSAIRSAIGRKLRTVGRWRFLVIVLFISTLLGAVILSTNSSTDNNSASTHEEFLAHVREAMAAAGGDWTFEDGETPWSLEVALHYDRETCFEGSTFADTGSEHYDITLLGMGVESPADAVTKVSDIWRANGLEVQTVIPASSGMPEIVGTAPDGTVIGYTVSKERSGIDAQSACTSNE